MKMIEGDDEKELTNATLAIEKTINNGVTDIDSIIATYYRIKNKDNVAINEINLKDNVPRIKAYKTDINIYDSLYKKVTAI